MDPEQIIEQLEIEENRGVNKSSHTKNPTLCVDVRRSGNACGICGSFNVINQGVKYCESCGLEVELLGEYSSYWWSDYKSEPICNCEYIISEYGYKISPRNEYFISKCLDCGAVNSNRLCPNCGSRRYYGSTWKHWDGRIKCSRCGFTINNSVSCSIGAKANKSDGKQGTKKAKEKAKQHMSRRKRKRLEAKNRQHPNKVVS